MAESSDHGADAARTPRGFAAMTPEERQRIARLGGVAAQAGGRAHRWTPAEAVEAGRDGGRRAHALGRAHRWTSEEAAAARRNRDA